MPAKEEKNKGGRPLKFKTVKELQEKVDAYFESCFKPTYTKRLTDDYNTRNKKLSPKENPTEQDWEWVAELDHEGNQIYEQIKPFTVTGLALFLGTSRETLLNYENNDKFFDTVKEAKAKIQEYAEEYLFSGKNQTSAIFNLKNNWGWVDKNETDINNPDGNLKTVIVKKAKVEK